MCIPTNCFEIVEPYSSFFLLSSVTVFFSCSALDTVVESASAIVADLESLAAFATKINHRPDKLLSSPCRKGCNG